MSQRYVSVVANVEGEDMGRAAKQVRKAVDDVGEPPRGVRIEEQAQLPKMTQMFESLGARARGCRVRYLRALDGLLSIAASCDRFARGGSGGARRASC